METVAFLGLGLLGSALSRAASERGEQVVVWNRNPEKAEALAALGIRVATSAVEAVRDAARVHLALMDDAAVDAVLELCGPALRSQVVIDHSTTSPHLTAQRAERLAEGGVRFLHAPVFMSPEMALAGRGTMIVAGPRAVFDAVADSLGCMAASVEYLGERADLAAAHKLITMSLVLAVNAGLADALTLAASMGVDLREAHARLMKADLNGVVARRGRAMVNADFTPTADVSMVRKDTKLELEAAERGGRALPMIKAIAVRLDELIARGHDKDDLAVLAIDALRRG